MVFILGTHISVSIFAVEMPLNSFDITGYFQIGLVCMKETRLGLGLGLHIETVMEPAEGG